MTTLRVLFIAVLLSLATEMPVPERADSDDQVAQSADVPSEVRDG